MSAGKRVPRETLAADLIRSRDLMTAYRCGRVSHGSARPDYSYRQWCEKVAELLPGLIDAASFCLDAAPDADAGRVEELERENEKLRLRLKEVAAGNVERDSAQAARISELERRIEILSDNLRWVLPMAKGWAHDHPVGNNAEIVAGAEAILRGNADA